MNTDGANVEMICACPMRDELHAYYNRYWNVHVGTNLFGLLPLIFGKQYLGRGLDLGEWKLNSWGVLGYVMGKLTGLSYRALQRTTMLLLQPALRVSMPPTRGSRCAKT